MKIKYPSLYADLVLVPGGFVTPGTAQCGGWAYVHCTATQRILGHIWWQATGGKSIVWHYRMPDGTQRGQRLTERNVVQALRDIANASSRRPLLEVLEDAVVERARKAPSTVTVTTVPVQARPSPAPSPAPSKARQRIVWNDDVSAFDVTAAIVAGLKGTK